MQTYRPPSNAELASRRERFPVGASLTLAQFDADPIGLPNRLRNQEPLTWFAEVNAWLVASRPLVEEVVRDETRFTADSPRSGLRQLFGLTMLTSTGEVHGPHRAPFDPAMRLSHVRDAYTDVIDMCSAARLDAIRGKGGVEFMRELAKPLGLDVVSRVLGFEGAERKAVEALVSAIHAGQFPEANEARVRAVQVRHDFAPTVAAALDRVRRTAPESILGIVASSYDGDLADELITNNTIALIFGGADTTATLLASTLWELLRNPAALADVQADRSLLINAVDEAARLRPPFNILQRFATVNTALAGVEIAADEEIWPLVTAANRDPAMFENPDAFDLHRLNVRKNSSFGRGLHFCIGQNLARLVAQRTVDSLLSWPGLRLDPDSPTQPTGFGLHELKHLNVLWDT